MHRFFVPGGQIDGSQFVIIGGDVRHIGRVLRLAAGDRIFVVTGDGREFAGELTAVGDDRVTGTLLEEQLCQTEPAVQVTVYQGLPKADKMDLIVQKCTEIGAIRIVPVATERAVVKLGPEKAGIRVARWQKIAEAAAKQSGRTSIPTVGDVLDFQAAVQAAGGHDLSVFPWELARGSSLKQVLRAAGRVVSIGIFIGPEGGFTREEAAAAAVGGLIPVTLGPRILRTETAAMVTVALALYELADLGGL